MDVIDAEDVSAVTVLWFLASDAPSTSLSLCFDGAERTDRLVPDRLRVSPSPLLPRLRGPWDPLCVRRPVYGSSKNSSGLLCPSSMLCFPFGVSRTRVDGDDIRRRVRTGACRIVLLGMCPTRRRTGDVGVDSTESSCRKEGRDVLERDSRSGGDGQMDEDDVAWGKSVGGGASSLFVSILASSIASAETCEASALDLDVSAARLPSPTRKGTLPVPENPAGAGRVFVRELGVISGLCIVAWTFLGVLVTARVCAAFSSVSWSKSFFRG